MDNFTYIWLIDYELALLCRCCVAFTKLQYELFYSKWFKTKQEWCCSGLSAIWASTIPTISQPDIDIWISKKRVFKKESRYKVSACTHATTARPFLTLQPPPPWPPSTSSCFLQMHTTAGTFTSKMIFALAAPDELLATKMAHTHHEARPHWFYLLFPLSVLSLS